ncbi:BTAD domain-containing putative transcriptional regulator [Streptomyces sp. NPDC016309]|uniref:AfsR/SARP family transcriptional regulator n=1 Tax=Streptomyces sp. NPDC016309 TaxID=3364965 RepID=UPI0036FDEF41
MAVRFGVLGAVEVRHDGMPVEVGHVRQRLVLGALLPDADRVVPADVLVDRVWGDRTPRRGREALYGYVSRLRHALAGSGAVLRRERGGYRLAVDPRTVDLHRFRALAGQARAADGDGTALAAWEEALALWRGEPFTGADTPWFNAQREVLERERLAARIELVDVRLRLGQHARVLGECAARAAEHPLDERVVGQLMVALLRSGRQAEALECFERTRRLLAGELGVDPGAPLRRLHRRILTADPTLTAAPAPIPGPGQDTGPGPGTDLDPTPASGRPPDAPTPAPAAAPPAPRPVDGGTGEAPEDRPGASARQPLPRLLPPAPPVFVGREEEIARARRLLGRGGSGPVTLLVTGPAGVGKTAFAVRTGHLLAPRYPDGQLYADLRGFGDGPAEPFTVLGTFLRALGVRGGAVPTEATGRLHLYRSLLAQRKILVVLDNAADALHVDDLLPSGDACGAVVTSRTTLAGLGGHRLPLGVLDPATGLTLLREMLGADRTAAEAESARSIVETCDGLPLAVWVAGARLAARPHWPLAKVARALADEQRKLDELAVGHIAVRASLELTYRGMDRTNRHALRMLALLPGPDFAAWALAALLDLDLRRAEAVLDDLVEVHLMEAGPAGGAGTRYRLHDLVRLLGRERAEREDPPTGRTAAFGRLLDASLHLADLAADTLSVDFQGISHRELASWRLSPEDVDQLLADPLAWFTDERQFLIDVADRALDGDGIAPAAALATTLTTLFQVGSHFDDWERLQSRALKAALSAGDRRSATQLHRCLGELTTVLDRYPEALDHFEQALRLADGEGPAHRAGATAGLAYVHRLLGQYASAVRYFDRAAELARTAGNVNCLVYATNGIGVIDLEQGRVREAMERFTQCLRASREAGYRPGEAQALRCLGQSHRALGALQEAADCFRRAASISEGLGDRLGATHATCWLGDVLVRRGAHREGRRLLARTLWTYREFGNVWGEAATLYALAEAQLAAGRPERARRRAEAAVTLWRRIGSRTWLAVGLDTLARTHALAGDPEGAARARDEAAALRAAAMDGARER